MNFSEFGFDDRLMESIESFGYKTATPVQEQAINQVLAGKDIIASAQTGTGKTAAFLLPVIQKILSSPPSESIKAMIIVPTRELAIQIDQNLEGLSYFTGVSSVAVYGGRDGSMFASEIATISNKPDILICTPGKMIAHLNMGHTDVSGLQYLILDEADRMLDIGFYDDIMKIISFLPKKRQNLLFSATMPPKIMELVNKVLNKPVHINIAISRPPEQITQLVYLVPEEQKFLLAKHLLMKQDFSSTIVFCSTKAATRNLCRDLKKAGLPAEEIHSDLEQNKREEVLLAFRNKKVKLLIATDIVARGIDVEDIDMVMNFDIPNDSEDYVHRIGRTARAESKGMAVTLVSGKELGKLFEIENLIGKQITQPGLPEGFGPAPVYSPEKFAERRKNNRNFRRKKPGHNPARHGKSNYGKNPNAKKGKNS